MKKEKKELTANQIKLNELLSQVHLTAFGKMNIPQLSRKFGNPKVVLKYAKVEARTGLIAKPTIVVERFVDGELVFHKDVVITGVTKELCLMVDYSGVEVKYVRHPSYNPAKMVKATDKEIKDFVLQSHEKEVV